MKNDKQEINGEHIEKFIEQLNKPNAFLFMAYIVMSLGIFVMMVYFLLKASLYTGTLRITEWDIRDVYFCSFMYLLMIIIPFLGSLYFSFVEKGDKHTDSEITYSIFMRIISILSATFIIFLFSSTFLEVVDVVIPEGKPLALILITFGIIKNLEFYFILRNKYGPINFDKRNKKEINNEAE